MTLLDLQNVTFAYARSRTAVRDVTLSIERGSFVSIIGPNGSGKSTLMKIMARVALPSAGTTRLDGRDSADWAPKEYARLVGYLPQNPEPAFPMRALDVVLSGRAPFLGRFRWESDEDMARAEDALRRCDAAELASRFLDQMSGGEKKRVFLARVLAGDPDLILLDEPLTALDVAHVQQLMMMLESIVRSTGKTVLMISHEINWSSAFSDRIIVLSEGRVVADGPPGTVIQAEIMRRYFGFDAGVLSDATHQWIVPRLPGR